MSAIPDLLNDLKTFSDSADGLSFDLRLDLADIILKHLDDKEWTQKALAEAAGMKPPFITRVIHGTQNCTFDVAARIAFALGVKVKIVEVPSQAVASVRGMDAEEHHHGKEGIKKGSANPTIEVKRRESVGTTGVTATTETILLRCPQANAQSSASVALG